MRFWKEAYVCFSIAVVIGIHFRSKMPCLSHTEREKIKPNSLNKGLIRIYKNKTLQFECKKTYQTLSCYFFLRTSLKKCDYLYVEYHFVRVHVSNVLFMYQVIRWQFFRVPSTGSPKIYQLNNKEIFCGVIVIYQDTNAFLGLRFIKKCLKNIEKINKLKP